MRTPAVIATALLIPALLFAADRLNVKTGLWEVTSTTETQGMPPMPPEVLAQMTPEQRAQLEAVLGSSAGAPRAHTVKECVTEEDLAQPFAANDDKNCVSTVVKSTPTSQEVDVVCSGKLAGTGKLRIDTPTPETMTGNFEIKAGSAGDAMIIKMKLKGRWLSASCKGATED